MAMDFIIDGIISVVIGIIGFYMIPGTPQDCYSIFLSDEEIRIARRRMKADQKILNQEKMPLNIFSIKIFGKNF